MKKLSLYILLYAMPLIGIAQSNMSPVSGEVSSSHHRLIKHFDVAVSIGTSGVAFEVATPLCRWSQLRLGGVFKPYKTYNCSLDVWRPLGMTDDDPVLQMITSSMAATPASTVEIEGHRKMQNLKLLWDIYPLKKHKNFYVTVGVFYGNKTLVTATNTNASFNTLSVIREYNLLYANAQKGEFLDLSELNISLPDDAQQRFNSTVLERIRQSEDMTIPIGTYSHDIYGADGQLLHRTGEYVMLRPDQNDIVSFSATVNRFKPYLGVGYTLPVSKDKRSSVSLDAGVIYWGGTPTVTTSVVEGNDSEGNEITTSLDLLKDVDHLPGDFGVYIRSAKSYPVYPEVSLRFTRRLW